MRKPSSLSPWFTVEQLVAWVKEAPDKTAYQRRLAIWLTHAGSYATHRVADLLAVSTQAVWKRVAESNSLGPSGLDRKRRGGRRWGLMTLEEECAFLAEHLGRGRKRRSTDRHAAFFRTLEKARTGGLHRLHLRSSASSPRA